MTQGKNTVSYDNFAVPKKPKSVSKMDTQQNTQNASFEDINKIAAGTKSYLNSKYNKFFNTETTNSLGNSFDT